MAIIRETRQYSNWFEGLKDRTTRARINVRIRRLSLGHTGVVKFVGDNVSELKIDFGPGYRVYFTLVGKELIILLGGGDKSSQPRDIKEAQKLARELKETS